MGPGYFSHFFSLYTGIYTMLIVSWGNKHTPTRPVHVARLMVYNDTVKK